MLFGRPSEKPQFLANWRCRWYLALIHYKALKLLSKKSPPDLNSLGRSQRNTLLAEFWRHRPWSGARWLCRWKVWGREGWRVAVRWGISKPFTGTSRVWCRKSKQAQWRGGWVKPKKYYSWKNWPRMTLAYDFLILHLCICYRYLSIYGG